MIAEYLAFVLGGGIAIYLTCCGVAKVIRAFNGK